MVDILLVVGTTVGGLILYVIIASLVRTPGKALQGKFVRIGDAQGQNSCRDRRRGLSPFFGERRSEWRTAAPMDGDRVPHRALV